MLIRGVWLAKNDFGSVFSLVLQTRSSAVAEGLHDVHVIVKFSYVVTEYV